MFCEDWLLYCIHFAEAVDIGILIEDFADQSFADLPSHELFVFVARKTIILDAHRDSYVYDYGLFVGAQGCCSVVSGKV